MFNVSPGAKFMETQTINAHQKIGKVFLWRRDDFTVNHQ